MRDEARGGKRASGSGVPAIERWAGDSLGGTAGRGCSGSNVCRASGRLREEERREDLGSVMVVESEKIAAEFLEEV